MPYQEQMVLTSQRGLEDLIDPGPAVGTVEFFLFFLAFFCMMGGGVLIGRLVKFIGSRLPRGAKPDA